MVELARISLLDNRLANQIAAGEVVERPASVVKELLENSVDAGATRIEVDIERGGSRLIRITDNGRGIHKEDMGLALTRHATSKISTSDDLASIQTLGFRGEALASISSVSKLTLTSRTPSSELAWQAIAQGREMAIDIQPAAAATGTRIEVADLFFNTPARQKFLRTEKTEFNHIEEVFKRQALANFNVAFVLKHNHKIVKRVPACAEAVQYAKRLATICGQPFVDNAIDFRCEHELVQISGWLGKPGFHRSESDIQYVFINGRPVKDKTLNHAIRQAYEGLLPAGRMATYVIYLNVDPTQVDVNVHPTKHEVRFSEQRLVHDLLAKSVSDALNEQGGFPLITSYQPHASDTSGNSTTNEPSENIAEHSEATYLEASNPERVTRHQYSDSSFTGQVNRDTYSYIQSVMNAKESRPESNLDDPQEGQSADINKSTQAPGHSAKPTFEQKHQGTSSSFPFKPLVDSFYLLESNGQKYFAEREKILNWFVVVLLDNNQTPAMRSLLFPQKVELSQALLEDVQTHEFLQKLGFDTQPANESSIEIKKIPTWLAPLGNDFLFSHLSKWSEQNLQASNALVAQQIVADLTKQGILPERLLETIFSSATKHENVEQLLKDGALIKVDQAVLARIFKARN